MAELIINGEKSNHWIHIIRQTDDDYPLSMYLVPNKEQYDLISIDGLVVVPLVQVLNAISSVKADIIIRDGVKYCANCGRILNAVTKKYFPEGE